MATKKKKKVAKKKATRKKKNTIIIHAEEEIKLGKFTKLYKVMDTYWIERKKLVGKKPKNCKDTINIIDTSTVSDIFIPNDTDSIGVHCKVTLSQLKSLVKKAEKMDTYWKKFNKERKKGQSKVYRSFVHLSPDLTFYVDYSNGRIKSE